MSNYERIISFFQEIGNGRSRQRVSNPQSWDLVVTVLSVVTPDVKKNSTVGNSPNRVELRPYS